MMANHLVILEANMTAKKYPMACSVRGYVHQLNVGCWRKMAVMVLLLAPFGMMTSVYASELSLAKLAPAKSASSDSARIAALEEQLTQLAQDQDAQRSTLEDLLNRVDITGYVSLRGGKLNEKDFTYLGALEDEWSFSSETTFGIQIKAPLADNASVLLQFSGDSLESQAEVDWAFLEYRVSSAVTVRGGRLRVPGFMVSEYREVGYAYPWVQTPLEVYGLTPFLRYEGLDLRYFLTLGEVDLRFNPFMGSTRNQELSVGRVRYAEQNSQFGGLDIQLNYHAITARFSYSKYDFDIVSATWDESMEVLIEGQEVVPGNPPVEFLGIVDIIDSLVDAATGFALANPTQAAVYNAEAASFTAQRVNYSNDSIMGGDQNAEYFSLGLSYDSEYTLIMAEVIKGGIDGAFPDAKGGYVTFGYRFGNWMPHLTYATIASTDDDERGSLPDFLASDALWTSPALAEVAAGIEGVNTLVNLVNEIRNLSSPDQRSWTLGLRWDPISGVAVKVEYQYIELRGESYGYILPKSIVDGSGEGMSAVGFQDKVDNVDVVKVSLDLVF